MKKALENIDGVSNAAASFMQKRAVVTLEKPVSDDVLKQAVEAEDYQVIEFI